MAQTPASGIKTQGYSLAIAAAALLTGIAGLAGLLFPGFTMMVPITVIFLAVVMLILLFSGWKHYRQVSVPPPSTAEGPGESENELLPFHDPSQMATILMSAMDAIITVNAGQRVVLFNAAAEKVFRTTAREALGKPIDVFIPERFRAAHPGHIRKFGETRSTARSVSHLGMLTGLRADGEEFPVEASVSLSGVGDSRLYTVIIRDISPRIRTEEEIRQLNKDLEVRVRERTAELAAAVRNLESFSAAVSHDLRAPLRHIAGFVDLLLENNFERVDDTGKRHLGIIRNSVHQMDHLIEDLLAFARSGSTELKRDAFEMDEVVRDVVQEVGTRASGRTIDWVLKPLPAVSADRQMIRVVWSNLLSNAVKFSGMKENAVIEIGHIPGTNGDTTFYVRDNGAGFNPSETNKLFMIFQRLHRPDEFEGTGLGLANVRRIIERHGGSVRAEGATDSGATFYFSIPSQKSGSPPGIAAVS